MSSIKNWIEHIQRNADKKARLLLVSSDDFVPYSRGGAQLSALERLKYLKRELEYEIIVLSASDILMEEIYEIEQINVIRVPQFDYSKWVRDISDIYDPNIIFAYLGGFMEPYFEAQKKKIPFVYALVNFWGLYDLGCLPEMPDIVFASSRFLANQAKNLYPDGKVVVSIPLIDLEALDQEQLQIKKMEENNSIGMINPLILKGGLVFKAMARNFLNIQFLGVRGYWIENQEVSFENCKNVKIINWMHKISKFYDQISILLVPSIYPEGFGRVVIEALYREIPVIASNRGGLIEASMDHAIHLNPHKLEEWEINIKRILNCNKEEKDQIFNFEGFKKKINESYNNTKINLKRAFSSLLAF